MMKRKIKGTMRVRVRRRRGIRGPSKRRCRCIIGEIVSEEYYLRDPFDNLYS
jgi:hypothetical protein